MSFLPEIEGCVVVVDDLHVSRLPAPQILRPGRTRRDRRRAAAPRCEDPAAQREAVHAGGHRGPERVERFRPGIPGRGPVRLGLNAADAAARPEQIRLAVVIHEECHVTCHLSSTEVAFQVFVKVHWRSFYWPSASIRS